MSKADGHRRAYGQFFTPDPVVACCYALLDGALPAMPRIVDPACGDGAFLRYAVTHGLTEREHVYGCDIDAALVGELRAGGLPGVYHADGLHPASLESASFDLVIGNPPYGIATAGAGAPAASETRFLLRALELARAGGYIALVLPSGVLANERLRAVRAELLQRCALLAVIALPRTTFLRAGTSAACSILLLRNTPAPPGHRAFFAQAGHLDDLAWLALAYRERHAPQDPNRQAHAHWLPQTEALARRMDAPFWRPDYLLLLERVAQRWPLRPLGELLDPRRDLIAGDHVRPSRGEAKGPGLSYEYYQTREFMAAGYNYAAIARCDERAYRRLSRTAVRQRDILVSCAGIGGAGNGRVCLITHRPGPSCTGDVFILRTHTPDPIFLFLFLSSRGGHIQLLRLQNGVGTANLSADELLQVMVPLVPPATQAGLAARYAPIAAAHDLAMAALARGDTIGFQRERVRSEALLAELRKEMDI